MANKDTKKREARQCVNDIFLNPPVSRADLKTRLARVDATTVRRLLVDDLDKRKIADDEGFMFVEALMLLGPGGQKNRLLKIASDHNRDKEERAFAFMALGHDKFEEGDPAQAEIGAELIDEMMSFSLRNLFMMDEVDIGPGVLDILKGLPSDDFATFFLEKLEEQRAQARVPAYIAYEHALQDDSLSDLHSEMIAAIEKEGHSQGITLLETLSSQTKDRSAQKGFQKAALKARTRMADPGMVEEVQSGFALASSCDGQGAIVVLACLENENGSLSLANVCLRVDREIRDGFYLPRISKDDLDDIVEKSQVGADINFVRLSIGEAANIVHSALEQHTKGNLPLDLDAQRAIACFQQSSSASLHVELDDKALLEDEFSVEDHETILDDPQYDSWFFDSADFDQCGVTPPDEFDIDTCQDEIDTAARKLDDPVIKERLLAMNRYMAWWSKRNDDEELAAMHLQAVQSMSDDFKNSPFVKAMVLKSFFISDLQKEFEDEADLLPVGNPRLRRYLRGLFFTEIKIPTGKDMAALDFTEAAHLAFEDLFEKLPGDIRPRPNLLPAVSYKVGKLVAESLQKKLPGTADRLMANVSLAINRTTGFDKSQSDQLAIVVVATLFDFTETVCTQCAVDCLKHPKQRMPDVFFSDEHPGAL